jgi:hypothetical protein
MSLEYPIPTFWLLIPTFWLFYSNILVAIPTNNYMLIKQYLGDNLHKD